MAPQDIAQIDANQVQVRVSLPVGFTLDVPKTRLNLKLSGPGGSRAAEMTLLPVSVARGIRSGGIFSPDTVVNTHTLRLAPEGARQLKAAQQFIMSNRPREFHFGIEVPFATVPKQAKEVVFWADLKLSNQDSFQPLVDGARIRFKNAAAGS